VSNQQPSDSTLVAIRAAHHPEAAQKYDRVVFEFTGPVPLLRVEYVKELIADGSGLSVDVAGRAILCAQFTPAYAHNAAGQASAPNRMKLSMALVKEVVSAGDFEAVVTYGIGLSRKADIRVITLVDASRIVIDVLV
jgi:hypothetical protein